MLTYPMPSAQPAAAPAAQLAGFLAKYTPEIAATANLALKKLRKLCPGAIELVYDNYNALAIGFGPSERASEAILSIAVYPRWVSLFFLQARCGLPDPAQRLQGKGCVVRHIVLENAATLDEPEVRALIAHALAAAAVPLDPGGKRRLVIKSVSAKQRPRRLAK